MEDGDGADDDEVPATAAALRSFSAPPLRQRLTPQGQDLEAIRRLVDQNPFAPIRPPSPGSAPGADGEPLSPLGGTAPWAASAKDRWADSVPEPGPSGGAPAPSASLPGNRVSSHAKGSRQRGQSVPPTRLLRNVWKPSLARVLDSQSASLAPSGAPVPHAAGLVAGLNGLPAPGGCHSSSGGARVAGRPLWSSPGQGPNPRGQDSAVEQDQDVPTCRFQAEEDLEHLLR